MEYGARLRMPVLGVWTPATTTADMMMATTAVSSRYIAAMNAPNKTKDTGLTLNPAATSDMP